MVTMVSVQLSECVCACAFEECIVDRFEQPTKIQFAFAKCATAAIVTVAASIDNVDPKVVEKQNCFYLALLKSAPVSIA